MSTRRRAPRPRWNPPRPVHPEPARAERLRPAAEVLGTRSQPDGSLRGPYEQTYAVDHGYALERSVTICRP
jgi:hypothetical protein